MVELELTFWALVSGLSGILSAGGGDVHGNWSWWFSGAWEKWKEFIFHYCNYFLFYHFTYAFRQLLKIKNSQYYITNGDSCNRWPLQSKCNQGISINYNQDSHISGDKHTFLKPTNIFVGNICIWNFQETLEDNCFWSGPHDGIFL